MFATQWEDNSQPITNNGPNRKAGGSATAAGIPARNDISLTFVYDGANCTIRNLNQISNTGELVGLLQEGLSLGLPLADPRHFRAFYEVVYVDTRVEFSSVELRRFARMKSCLVIKEKEDHPWTTKEIVQWRLSCAVYILMVLTLYGYIWTQDLSWVAVSAAVLVAMNGDAISKIFEKYDRIYDSIRIALLVFHVGFALGLGKLFGFGFSLLFVLLDRFFFYAVNERQLNKLRERGDQ